jgi:hypothetical protein
MISLAIRLYVLSCAGLQFLPIPAMRLTGQSASAWVPA